MADTGLIFPRNDRIVPERAEMTETAEKTRSTERTIEIRRSDLPLSCPRPQDEIWNMHPRVYLPIDKTGEEVCPYCGARYILEDWGTSHE
jgi:uncharacterized Zn-finger protein